MRIGAARARRLVRRTCTLPVTAWDAYPSEAPTGQKVSRPVGHSAHPIREQRPSLAGVGPSMLELPSREGPAPMPAMVSRRHQGAAIVSTMDRCADSPHPARATRRATPPWHARVGSVGRSAGCPSRIAAAVGDGARRRGRRHLHRRAHRPPGERPGSDRGRRSASARVTGPGRPGRWSVARQGRCAGHARGLDRLPVPVCGQFAKVVEPALMTATT